MKSGNRRISISARIIIFNFISFFMLYLALSYMLYSFWTNIFNREINGQLERRARLIGHIWAEESEKGGPGLKERMDADIGSVGSRAAIYDTLGRRIYMKNIPHAPRALPAELIGKLRGREHDIRSAKRGGSDIRTVITGFREDGRLRGFVMLEFRLDALANARESFIRLVPAMALAVIPIIFLQSLILGQGIRNAIKTFSGVTGRINADNFNERIDVSRVYREFASLAEDYNKMCDRLGDSFSSLRRLTADAAHELRTPLSIIRSRLEVSLRKDRQPDEYVEAISEAHNEIIRLSKTVNALLMMARSESGVQVFTRSETDLSALVKEVADFVSPVAEDKGIALNMDLQDQTLVFCDEEWFRHVVFNILDNAIKFCGGGDEISVYVSHGRERCMLRVTDTGPGIPEEHLPFIFDRFYKAGGPGGANRGTGLGLALCRWVVEAHGGEITASGGPGGAVFTATLPVTA